MPLQRKPIPLASFTLTEPADLIAALTSLSAAGWRGQVNCVEETWRLELNTDSPTRQIIATIGEVLVDDLGWRLLTAEQADANYDEVSE